MTLHMHSPYYVTEQCEEKSIFNVKKKKNLCPWEVQILKMN